MIKQLKYRYANSKFAKQKSSSKFVWFVFFVLVAWFLYGMMFNTKKVEEVKAPELVKVDVEKLSQKNIVSDVLVFGHTEASEKVDLRVRTAGIVDTIFKKKGEYVKKGDVILTIKMEDRIAKLAAAQAAKDKAEIEYNTAVSLLEQGLISRVEFVANEANYRSAKATLQQMSLDLGYTSLRAPFDGVINELNVEKGSYVSKESTVGVFLNLNPIKISAQLPEKYISRVKKGVVAKVKLSNKMTVDGILTYVASVADTSTRTFGVELEAPNKNEKIVEGLTAEINLPLDNVYAVKLNASSCLTFGDDGSVGVKTINDENVVAFYPIEIVKEEESGLWVSGLPADVNVIVAGGEFVRAGEKVIPHFLNENIEAK
ncbi:MAG: efflux RND transporter periplasmic adaptor subunit [Alphaproteobacteria bacterium]|nr:efflux RND transporter periplasmic adaptor subunit [Alphaproteobacteria bacterium]